MDKNLKKQKIALWQKQIVDLESQLQEVLLKKGEAAQLGDLRENAAYQDYSEQAEVVSSRIATVQKMIKDLEKS